MYCWMDCKYTNKMKNKKSPALVLCIKATNVVGFIPPFVFITVLL
jgi:hypothetical protein